MQIKLYVAGPWADRENVRKIADKVREAGFVVTSNWLDVAEAPEPGQPGRDEYLQTQAVQDLQNVMEADGLVYVNSMKSEGKATEFGVALATLKPIIIVGNRENNIFLNLDIPCFPTIEEAIGYMHEQIGLAAQGA
jgi:nucleoside 2-deoxyribosyltransferase